MSAVTRAQDAAVGELRQLFPPLRPWAAATLGWGFGDQTLPAVALTADDFAELRDQRLLGILASALSAHPDLAPGRLRTDVQQANFAAVVQSQIVISKAAVLVTELERKGIPLVVIKGPAVARCYRIPTERTYGDVDLLVESQMFSEVMRHLNQWKWAENPNSLQPRPYFHRWCRESVNFTEPSGGRVDVHHRPSPWMWTAKLDALAVRHRAVSASVADMSVQFADRADNLLISSLQLISDHLHPGAKLIAWRDIAELGRVDAVGIASRANDTGLGGILRGLLLGMPSWLQPPGLVDHLDPDIRHAARVVSMLTNARSGSFLRAHTARLPALNTVAYMSGTALPARTFLHDRYPDTSYSLLRWWQEMAGSTAVPGVDRLTTAGTERE